MESPSNLCLILILAMVTRVANSVPHEFCLDEFDDDDCGEVPTSVLYYYKPGSRCEVRTWRGCPTLNKFPDYFSCLHFCVGSIWGAPVEIPILSESAEEEEKEHTIKVAEIEEAQYVWREEIRSMKYQEIKVWDEILDEAVDMVDSVGKLTLKFDDSAETTTFSWATLPSDFEIEEQEVVVT